MKTFLIAGAIVATDAERETFEDVTPTQFNAFLKSLESGEEIHLDITSVGGDVAAGIAICNLIKKASAAGHKSTAHVIGAACSMASALACSCDKLTIDSNAFLMVHLPWTMAIGNALDLRKEAETLDKFRDALVSIYRTKFQMSDPLIVQMLEAETWIVGADAAYYNLDAEIIQTATPLKVAASIKRARFAKVPKAIKELIMDEKTKDEVTVETKETVTETTTTETVTETTTTETTAEEKPEEESPAEEETPEEENEEANITKAECDKRVSGMQSTMQGKINALQKEHDARIKDFEIQLETRGEELAKAQAETTRLGAELEKVQRELQKTASALAQKTETLAKLNANVLTPQEQSSDAVKNWRAAYIAMRNNHKTTKEK